ncbi:MAG: efflux RND transporter periplasmic adaptor subunit [Sedimentisphaerales bacterium]|nr:efflux RND transporter periplasmic adaptor subunit [Sedimentisphaerales bacterium]
MHKGVVKTLIIIAIVIVIIFVLGTLLVKKTQQPLQPTTVRLEVLNTGDLQEFISAPGEIEPKTKVEISAKVSARVVELPFKEGQQVKAGDLVIRLDAKEMESRLKSAQANFLAQEAQLEVSKTQIASRKAQIKGTEATLEQVKKDHERQKKLLSTGDISQSVYDLARQKLDELESQLKSATFQIEAEEKGLIVAQHNLDAQKAQIEEAQDALEYTTIRSPIDGVITRINAEVGEMVMTGTMNNPGTVIMIIADLSKMLLVAQVDEADVGKLALGQEANIRVKAFWDHIYRGKVDHIALTNDNSQSTGTKYYRTEILIEGDVSKLYSGLTADVDIFTQKHTDILKVPSQAILTRKGDDLPADIRSNPLVDANKTDVTVVFRYNNKKAIATPVRIGPGDTTHIIIKEGLKVGDQIIIGPYKVLDALKHEQAVRDEKEVEAEMKAKEKTESAATSTEPKAS